VVPANLLTFPIWEMSHLCLFKVDPAKPLMACLYYSQLSEMFTLQDKRINMFRPGMVAHACNPSYEGGRGARILVQGQLGKSTRPYLINS
jgi:hypothetical protein